MYHTIKNALYNLLLCIASGVGIVLYLFLTAKIPNKQPNGFARTFGFADVALTADTKPNKQLKQIADLTPENIYFSTNTPNQFLVADHSLKVIKSVTLPWSPSLRKKTGQVYRMKIDNDNAYIFACNAPAVIRISVPEHTLKWIPVKGPAISLGIVLTKDSFVIRQFTRDGLNMQFVKINAANGNQIQENQVSLTSWDGGISTDGQLHYDKHSHLLTYVHYYNNTVLTFDTTLSPVSRFNTIDTVSPKLILGKTAPLIVNQKSCVDKKLLLVCSNLKADNETYADYMNQIPVDVYDTIQGIYRGSFYLPVYEGKTVKSIALCGNTLAALYHNNQIAVFTISLPR